MIILNTSKYMNNYPVTSPRADACPRE